MAAKKKAASAPKKSSGKTTSKPKPSKSKTSKKTVAKVKSASAASKSTSKTTKAAKPVTKKKTSSKTTSAPAKTPAAKTASKRTTAKKKTATGAAKPIPNSMGVTVQIGGKKPAICIAPGVKISNSSASKLKKSDSQNSQAIERKISRKELQEIRDILLQKRKDLLHGMKRELDDYRKRSSNTPLDEADKAADAYDEDLSFEIASTNDEELQEIERALEKIDNKTYGECEMCGCSISASRMKILPYAVTCVNCRDEKERTASRENTSMTWGFMSEDSGEGEE